MKTKNSDIAVKIFLVVVGVILVGLLVAWSTGVFKDKKNDLSRSTEKINNVIGSLAEFDLLVYEGESIKGDTVIDLIKDVEERELNITITVITNINLEKKHEGTIYGKDNNFTLEDNKTKENYINPNGLFIGEIQRNENGMVENITFTQKDKYKQENNN